MIADPLMAKSATNGRLTLVEHTAHVLAVIRPMARTWRFDESLAGHGAILHDTGKGHSVFQRRLKRTEDDEGDFLDDEPFRHEISSLLFLPLFDHAEWPALIEMVAAHHKSIRKDARELGLLDFVMVRSSPEWTFERHAGVWEEWAPRVCREVLPHFGIDAEAPSIDEAREAFEVAVAYTRSLGAGWSRWRGLLMAADHFGSALMHEAPVKAGRLFGIPDMQVFERPHPLYPLSQRRADDPAPHTLVVAPTGAGKTDYLLRRCRGRIFYVLPFQASINAMFERLDRAFNGPKEERRPSNEQVDVRRVHAASRLLRKHEDYPEEDQLLQRHPGAAVKVLTPHQIAPVLFGTSGHEAMALDLEGADVILDEVHVYNDVAQAMVFEMVGALVRLGCRVHIGSATMPTSLTEAVLNRLLGEGVLEVRLTPEETDSFDRHTVRKESDEELVWKTIRKAIRRGERVIWVSNQVARAQKRFQEARIRLKGFGVDLCLVHSRYRRADRQKQERQIMELGKYPRLESDTAPALVFTTQVVEVSLDVSFDRMVTDAAPLDALVQRFGRVNRGRHSLDDRVLRPVHVLEPPMEDAALRPYDPAVVRASYAALPEGILHERETQDRLDRVYPALDLKDIKDHLFRKDDAYTLHQMRHRPRSYLAEQLDIDSYSLVRLSDAEAYAAGHGRSGLEIPVSRHVLMPLLVRHSLEQLRTGNYPFIIPNSFYDEVLGLDPSTDNQPVALPGVFL